MYSLTEQLLAANAYLAKAPEERQARKTGRRPTTLEAKVATYFKYETAMKGKGWLTTTAFRDIVRDQEKNPDFTLEGARHVLHRMLLPVGLIEVRDRHVGKGTVRVIKEWRWIDKPGS